MTGCNQMQRPGSGITIIHSYERLNVIAEHSPLRCITLEAVVFKNTSSAGVNIQIEVIEEHLTPVEQYKPEDVDLIVSVPGIIPIDSK